MIIIKYTYYIDQIQVIAFCCYCSTNRFCFPTEIFLKWKFHYNEINEDHYAKLEDMLDI